MALCADSRKTFLELLGLQGNQCSHCLGPAESAQAEFALVKLLDRGQRWCEGGHSRKETSLQLLTTEI